MGSKKNRTNTPPTGSAKIVYLVRTSAKPLVWVGVPPSTRTGDRTKAAVWADELMATTFANKIAGTVVAHTIESETDGVLAEARRQDKPPRPIAKASLGVGVSLAAPETITSADSSPVPREIVDGASGSAASRPRKLRGLDRAELVRIIEDAGLPHLPKGATDHYGLDRGARIVVPRSASITVLYGYKLPGGPGHKTPEERKAEGIGAVTNVLKAPSLDEAKALVAAVVQELTSSAEGSQAEPAMENQGATDEALQRKTGASGDAGPEGAS